MTQHSKDEWGPWVDHGAGSKCPVDVGLFIEALHITRRGETPLCRGMVTLNIYNSACWEMADAYGSHAMITKYRIRKPRGMAVLEAIARDVPEYISTKENT